MHGVSAGLGACSLNAVAAVAATVTEQMLDVATVSRAAGTACCCSAGSCLEVRATASLTVVHMLPGLFV